jgi:hypothetical protein
LNKFNNSKNSYVHCCVLKSNGSSEISYIKSRTFYKNDFPIIITPNHCYFSPIPPKLLIKDVQFPNNDIVFYILDSKLGLISNNSDKSTPPNTFVLWAENISKKSFIRTIKLNSNFQNLKNKINFISSSAFLFKPNISKILCETANLFLKKIK